jgi:HEAT repeat protein
LAHLGEEGVAVFALLLRAEPVNDGVRAAIIQALGINPSDAATEALISALANQSATVRAVTVEVLTERSGDLATLALAKAVREDDSTVLREIAAVGLGERGDESVTPTLLQALTDPDLSVRYAAASAIELIGDKRAITGLVDALDVLDLDSTPVVPRSPGSAVERQQLGIRIALCLKKLSGVEHGIQVLAWRAWLKQQAGAMGPQLPSPF